MSAASVIGRDDELGDVEAFLARVEEGPRALVLSGEPGIGKTILWQTGVEDASKRLGRVLTCHGVEAEASLSFAGLSDLLGRRAGGSRSLACAPAPARARDRADAGGAGRDGTGSARDRAGRARHPARTCRAGVGARRARRRQWLDPASAAVLQIALRRLSAEPIGLLATMRRARARREPFELERAFPVGRLERMTRSAR